MAGWALVVHAVNSSTREAEVGRILWVWDQSGLQRELQDSLSQKTKQQKGGGSGLVDVFRWGNFKMCLACKSHSNHSNLCDLINYRAIELWSCMLILKAKSTSLLYFNCSSKLLSTWFSRFVIHKMEPYTWFWKNFAGTLQVSVAEEARRWNAAEWGDLLNGWGESAQRCNPHHQVCFPGLSEMAVFR